MRAVSTERFGGVEVVFRQESGTWRRFCGDVGIAAAQHGDGTANSGVARPSRDADSTATGGTARHLVCAASPLTTLG
ncbi:MAG: hypothetical protein ABEI99_10195, partial [Halobaculum sp.]